MEMAIEALKLFMRSLPEGCRFQIISFGSQFRAMNGSEKIDMIAYNQESKDRALAHIESMDANLGGTNILKPLTATLEQNKDSKKQRIFLLTDGQVGNPDKVMEAARNASDVARVFTFGIGSGCDANLVKGTARAGRGTYTIVKDGCSDLNGLVIKALTNAMEPSLKDTTISWNGIEE